MKLDAFLHDEMRLSREMIVEFGVRGGREWRRLHMSLQPNGLQFSLIGFYGLPLHFPYQVFYKLPYKKGRTGTYLELARDK